MTEEHLPDWLGELPLRSDAIGYSADELVACEACSKQNPPTRTACLYCGAALQSDASVVRVEIGELEAWENGHNIVIVSGRDAVSTASAEVVRMLRITEDYAKAILDSSSALPIARVGTEETAGMIVETLASKGIEALSIADEKLASNVPQSRLRAIRFRPTEVTLDLFNTEETVSLSNEDIALISVGTIFRSRTDTIDKRKRGVTRTIGETKTSSDDIFVDLYSRRSSVGWRVPSTGFDFSCLGDEKSLLAFENFQRLATKLREFAPNAKFVDDYNAVRQLLEASWPDESRRENQGYQRTGFAQKGLTSTFTTDNSVQALKYSRLHWHLL